MERRSFIKGVVFGSAAAALGLSSCKEEICYEHEVNGWPLPKFCVGWKDPYKPLPAPRNWQNALSGYLEIPRLGGEPHEWEWRGKKMAVYPPLFALWFEPPKLNQSTTVIVPVRNVGNSPALHVMVEVLESPVPIPNTLCAITRTCDLASVKVSPSQCELRDRKGPFVLQPGYTRGFELTFTRRFVRGSAVAICYDPFVDPKHTIQTVGGNSNDRKNLNGNRMIPPIYS